MPPPPPETPTPPETPASPEAPPTMRGRVSGPIDPVLRKSRGFPLVWLVPLVAVGIGLWLAWTSFMNKGPIVTVTFTTADGIEAGKTRVKYLEVDVGLVEVVRVLPDLSGVAVEARIEPDFAPRMTDATRFWVVRPRVGFSGVTGLGTLLSGAYIEVDPGEGEAARSFTGLEEPPLIRSGAAGSEFLLVAEDLGSVSRGAPVYYRGFPVGQVLGYRLADDARRFEIPIFIESPYDRLVAAESHFWDVSGIRFSAGPNGIEVQVATLATIAAGGVAFSSPAGMAGVQAPTGTQFALYPDEASIGEVGIDERIPYVIEFDGSVRGLRAGAPVEFRGIRVGSVERVVLVRDFGGGRAPIRVYINLEPQRVAASGAEGAPIGDDVEAQHAVTRDAVASGLRAQLKTGNILTGDLFIDLDFYPDAPPAAVEVEGGLLRIPAVPTDLETLTATVSGLLERLAELPLEEIGGSLARATEQIDTIIGDPAFTAGIADLAAAGSELRALLARIGDTIGPLAGSTEGTLAAARGTIAQAERTMRQLDSLLGDGSSTRYQLERVLQELASAARSIRGFAEALERDPGAVIRGRREF